MGGIYSTRDGHEISTHILVGKPEGEYLRESDLDGKLILNAFNRKGPRVWIGFSCLGSVS